MTTTATATTTNPTTAAATTATATTATATATTATATTTSGADVCLNDEKAQKSKFGKTHRTVRLENIRSSLTSSSSSSTTYRISFVLFICVVVNFFVALSLASA